MNYSLHDSISVKQIRTKTIWFSLHIFFFILLEILNLLTISIISYKYLIIENIQLLLLSSWFSFIEDYNEN